MVFSQTQPLQQSSPSLPVNPTISLLPGIQKQVIISGLLEKPDKLYKHFIYKLSYCLTLTCGKCVSGLWEISW